MVLLQRKNQATDYEIGIIVCLWSSLQAVFTNSREFGVAEKTEDCKDKSVVWWTLTICFAILNSVYESAFISASRRKFVIGMNHRLNQTFSHRGTSVRSSYSRSFFRNCDSNPDLLLLLLLIFVMGLRKEVLGHIPLSANY